MRFLGAVLVQFPGLHHGKGARRVFGIGFLHCRRRRERHQSEEPGYDAAYGDAQHDQQHPWFVAGPMRVLADSDEPNGCGSRGKAMVTARPRAIYRTTVLREVSAQMNARRRTDQTIRLIAEHSSQTEPTDTLS